MASHKMDYRNRPAKTIERHLIVELCRALMHSHPTEDFQYIGMGALEFLDFSLFHRALGLKEMVSIEQDKPDRYEFNKPFASIKIVSGRTSDVLSGRKVSLKKPSIIWLDYTSKVDALVLDDVEQIVRTVRAPSLLIVTVNAKVSRSKERMDELTGAIPAARIPSWVDADSLALFGLAKAQRQILTSAVESALVARAEPAKWKQVLNLYYQDNALMQTLGGLILPVDVEDASYSYDSSRFNFVREGDDFLDLRVPVITAAERMHLDRQLPLSAGASLSGKDIPREDLRAYEHIYRYLHYAGLQSSYETTWTE